MDSIKQRLKQIVTKIYVFVRAAMAAADRCPSRFRR